MTGNEHSNQTVINEIMETEKIYYSNWIKQLYKDIEEMRVEKEAWKSLSSMGNSNEWLTLRRNG